MRRTLLIHVIALSLLAVPAFGEGLFLHIDVEERDDDGVVQINLPLEMIELGIAVMPRPFHVEGRITVGNLRITHSDLETLRDALADLGPGERTELRFGRRRVSASESAGLVVLHSPARGWWDEEVEIRVPTAVLEAFLGGEDELDLIAGLRELAEHPESVIRIDDEDGHSTARIWVDGRKEISR